MRGPGSRRRKNREVRRRDESVINETEDEGDGERRW